MRIYAFPLLLSVPKWLCHAASFWWLASPAKLMNWWLVSLIELILLRRITLGSFSGYEDLRCYTSWKENIFNKGKSKSAKGTEAGMKKQEGWLFWVRYMVGQSREAGVNHPQGVGYLQDSEAHTVNMNSGDGWCPQRPVYLGGEISVGSRGEFSLSSSSVRVQNRVCLCNHPVSSNMLSSERFWLQLSYLKLRMFLSMSRSDLFTHIGCLGTAISCVVQTFDAHTLGIYSRRSCWMLHKHQPWNSVLTRYYIVLKSLLFSFFLRGKKAQFSSQPHTSFSVSTWKNQTLM